MEKKNYKQWKWGIKGMQSNNRELARGWIGGKTVSQTPKCNTADNMADSAANK